MGLPQRRRAPAGTPSASSLMRLVRFPAVRRRISSALARAVPEKVHATKGYVRFRLEDPKHFVPGLFSTIPVGSRGTLLVIGTRKGDVRQRGRLSGFMKTMRRAGETGSRRSMIYQLRRAGVIGGSRTQAVLVPISRVMAAARAFLPRPSTTSTAAGAAANPILATLGFNPGRAARNAYACYKCGKQIKGKVVHYDPPVLHTRMGIDFQKAFHPRCYEEWQAQAGRELGLRNPLTRSEAGQVLRYAHRRIVGARIARSKGWREKQAFQAGAATGAGWVTTQFGPRRAHDASMKVRGRAWFARPNAGVRRNPGPVSGAIRVPFRTGQKLTTEQIRKFIASLPDWLKRKASARFEKCVGQYKRFHLGKLPPFWKFHPQGLGMSKEMTDLDFVVSEGKEWMAPYQVPRHSGKYDPKVSGRYVHAHGDSKVDIDVKRPVGTSKLPERFHTPDGKFVGVIPSRNVKIGAWYTG